MFLQNQNTSFVAHARHVDKIGNKVDVIFIF